MAKLSEQKWEIENYSDKTVDIWRVVKKNDLRNAKPWESSSTGVAKVWCKRNARAIALVPQMYEKLSEFVKTIEASVYDFNVFYDEFLDLVASTKDLLDYIDGTEKTND